jgi:hypothetical protein
VDNDKFVGKNVIKTDIYKIIFFCYFLLLTLRDVSVNLIADGRGGHRKTGENAMSNIKFYNTNDLYGDAGPFDAESKDAIADEMQDEFEGLAIDERNKITNSEIMTDEEADAFDAKMISEMREEFVNGLVAQYHGEPRLIFDNGGGITLQLPGFAHHYDDAEQCAEDIDTWNDEQDTDGWEGNEEESVFEPTQQQIANGGYRVYSLASFMDRGNRDELRDSGWSNVSTLNRMLVD